METVSRPTRKKSWRERPKRVSVLAEMALRKDKLAGRLTELRERDSLSQEQAAQKVGITVRQWQRWETGESVPFPQNMDRIASRFGISVAEFFDDMPLNAVEAATRLDGLEDEVSELRAAIVALSADVLRHTTELQGLRGKGRPRARKEGRD